jgi:hypothetical protein
LVGGRVAAFQVAVAGRDNRLVYSFDRPDLQLAPGVILCLNGKIQPFLGLLVMLEILKHLFTPHVSNDHRPRVLQPTGLLVLVGVFWLYQAFFKLAAAADLPRGLVLGYASSIDASGVIAATNGERAKNGLPALTHNALLSQAAAAKATHMFQNDYWAHVAPDGTTPWNFIKNAGYGYQVAGENLARDFGETSSMMAAWMNSPTHRENILHEKYSEIGIAVVNGTLQGTETTLVVQMFGTPTKAMAQVPAESRQATTVAEAAVIPTTVPTRRPEPTATPTLAPALAVVQPPVIPDEFIGATLSINSRANEGMLMSPLMLSKAVGTSMVILLLLVLVYDQYVVEKHRIPRIHGKNWAHATLFAVMLLLLSVMSQGKVL